jgi:peroxiredoxin
VAELRGLGGIHQELAKLGVQVAAVSVDPSVRSKRLIEKANLPFPILADTNREVVRAYGLLHEGGGLLGEDIAIPAHVLIGPDGTVLWQFVSHRLQQRLKPAAVLQAVEAHVVPPK